MRRALVWRGLVKVTYLLSRVTYAPAEAASSDASDCADESSGNTARYAQLRHLVWYMALTLSSLKDNPAFSLPISSFVNPATRWPSMSLWLASLAGPTGVLS